MPDADEYSSPSAARILDFTTPPQAPDTPVETRGEVRSPLSPDKDVVPPMKKPAKEEASPPLPAASTGGASSSHLPMLPIIEPQPSEPPVSVVFLYVRYLFLSSTIGVTMNRRLTRWRLPGGRSVPGDRRSGGLETRVR